MIVREDINNWLPGVVPRQIYSYVTTRYIKSLYESWSPGLSVMTNSADALVNEFKKSGAFDTIRAQILEQILASDYVDTVRGQIDALVSTDMRQRLENGQAPRLAPEMDTLVSQNLLDSEDNIEKQQSMIEQIVQSLKPEIERRLKQNSEQA